MKKRIALILAAVMAFSLLAACGSSGSSQSGETTTAAPANDKLLVGYSAVNITPEASVPLSGYGRTLTRMSTGILSYLFVTCTAVTGTNGETVLHYGLDLIGSGDAYSLASKVTEATGVPEQNIIMSASHTHSAPDLLQEQLPAIQTFKQKLGDALVKAGQEAMENRSPAEMYIATVQTESLNFVRRYVLENGTYAGDNYGDFSSSPIASHESEVDNTMQLIKFVREDDKDVILANFQTHPHRTGGASKYDISADIVGRFRDTLSAELDCHVSYFTGGSGNVNPTSRVEEENIYGDWKAHGDAMAAAATAPRPAASSPALRRNLWASIWICSIPCTKPRTKIETGRQKPAGQSVKKVADRQNADFDSWRFLLPAASGKMETGQKHMRKTPCCARHFDLLRNSHSTVPMYADECELLVSATSLTSASLSKTVF